MAENATESTLDNGPASEVERNPDFLTLWEFFSECFVPLNQVSLPLKPAHKEICDALQSAVMGELRKQFVIINIPPRCGKTKILEALICWQVAYFPDSQIITTSYSSDLAETSLRYVRKTLQEPWFIQLFRHEKLLGSVVKADVITTSHGGNIYASGNGGTLTGKGGGLKRPCGGFISIDDPAKPTEALSVVESANVREWFELTLKDRRNSDEWCPIIIDAQRLALDDLPGYIVETYPDDHLLIKVKALDETTQTSNFPETYSTENLIAARDSTVSNIRFAYWSKMQQEPIAQGGNLIPVDKFPRYDAHQGMKWDRRVITCDTALRAKEHNDSSSFELWGYNSGKAYLIDLAWGKWESPELLVMAETFWLKHMTPVNRVIPPATRFKIEAKAAGTGLAQQLRKKGIPAEEIERNIDKVSRVNAILPFIETGMMVLPRTTDFPWMPAFESELAQFRADGKQAHDDVVDPMVDAAEELLGHPPSILDVLGVRPNKLAQIRKPLR